MCLAVSVLLGTLGLAAEPTQAEFLAARTSAYVVRYKPNVDYPKAIASEIKRGTRPTAFFTVLFPGFAAKLKVSDVQRLKRDRRVASVSEMKSYSVPRTATLRSPGYVWGRDRINQRQLPLDNSFVSADSGDGVTAYIIDSGVEATHPEFSGRVQAGFSSIRGYSATTDCSGHGTHVAGTVGGTNVGVARNVSIVPVRVFPCRGGASTDTILRGIEYVVAHHQKGDPAVANLSLGGPADPALDYGIRMLVADGVTAVVAAGNDNKNACTVSPARETSAITVGASTQSDLRATFSNFGSCLDIFAPGQEIMSSWIGGNYAILDGTSMASPYVTGIAALLLQSNPQMTPNDVQSSIKGSATSDVLSAVGVRSPNRLAFIDTSRPPTSTTTTLPSQSTTTLPAVKASIVSDKFTRSPGGSLVSSVTLAGSGFTWVYYEVTLSDPSGKLPETMGGQLCPIDASYPDFNRCTGSTFGRNGSGYYASYVGLLGIGSSAYRGLWKMTFDSSSRIESPRRLIVN